MKNILLLVDAYYPNSRATVAIVQRVAETLVKKGNKVTVFTNRQDKETFVSHNGVDIVYIQDEYAKSNNLFNKILSKICSLWNSNKYGIKQEYDVLYK